jgi:hypothetical protein
MAKDIPSEIFTILQTPLQKAGKRAPVTPKRQANINWVENLPRAYLSYQRKEKQVLIYTTRAGERIFIQYPGKESARKNDNKRPWDFRPRLYSLHDDNHHFDMSFGDMLKTICDAADALDKKNKKDTLRIFAALLYRMAYMLDHAIIEPFSTTTRDVIYKNGEELKYSDEKVRELPAIFKYQPKEQILKHIAKEYPRWGNMSFEGFLFYYELLVWNEDCKYYYRNHYIKKNEEWINDKGRVNTLLTGIRIIGYLLGNISLPDLIDGFSMGISPASRDEVMRICGGLVKTE